MKIKVDHYEPISKTVVTETGFRYRDTIPVVVNTEIWEGTEDEIFLRFYKANNRLRYCNDSYFRFVDKDIQALYEANFHKYNTFENYYGNGVVD